MPAAASRATLASAAVVAAVAERIAAATVVVRRQTRSEVPLAVEKSTSADSELVNEAGERLDAAGMDSDSATDHAPFPGRSSRTDSRM